MSKIMEKDFKEADFSRQIFRASPPEGTKLDDLLEPEYWAHVARRVNPHDIIEVVPVDGSFFARFFVLNVGKLSVKLYKLEYCELNAAPVGSAAPKATSLFEPKFSGPLKWNVIRKSDKQVVSSKPFQTREEAEEWIEKNSKDLMAA